MLYNAFLLARHPKSARSHVNIYIPKWYVFLGPTWLSIPDCISICSAFFLQLMAESVYFTVCVKTWLTFDWKN